METEIYGVSSAFNDNDQNTNAYDLNNHAMFCEGSELN